MTKSELDVELTLKEQVTTAADNFFLLPSLREISLDMSKKKTVWSGKNSKKSKNV